MKMDQYNQFSFGGDTSIGIFLNEKLLYLKLISIEVSSQGSSWQ